MDASSTRTAGVAAVSGAPRPIVGPTLVLAAWSTFFFVLSGVGVRWLGGWMPEVGVLLVVAVTVRVVDARPVLAALAVSAGRIAIGVDPPIAVLAAYLAVAAAHAALAELVDAGQLAFRLTGVVLSTVWVVGWLCLVHVLRNDLPLDLAERAPGLAMRTALSTAVVAPLVIPVLRRLPGVGSFGGRR